MNLDKLKSDIANNEICVLVNGQPETVDFKQWCKDMAEKYGEYPSVIKEIVEAFISKEYELVEFAKVMLQKELDY